MPAPTEFTLIICMLIAYASGFISGLALWYGWWRSIQDSEETWLWWWITGGGNE